ncbi:histidine phosphatase family protein [Streptomyces triticirhizae]|uniref:Histidine phosphatase family protein n=1 Tax=Streptomyces triticirhizae TaxID=2483353 RepID=A0A3M2M4Y2_9ACTN|nr:histidine phosphatase family protein [Streptomyces triticirhizae]RMI44636.1 histidine phosphatase family protein [Streptomyces triticirhizae]
MTSGTEPAAKARLLLARHAETVWHAENRYAGSRSDPDLTERGLRQVEALARGAVAAGVDAVVSSPLRRAVRTATPAAEALGVEVLTVPELREVDFGELEGRTRAEADPELVRRFVADPVAHPFPGAEPPAEAAARVSAALRAVAERLPGHTVLVVGHSTGLRLALCSLLGLPVAHYRRTFPRLENVAVTELRLPADASHPAALLSLNRTLPVRTVD